MTMRSDDDQIGPVLGGILGKGFGGFTLKDFPLDLNIIIKLLFYG
jgi:hypothetical protein